MDFDLSEEQSLLKDGIGRLLASQYDFDRRRAFAATDEGWSRAMWAHYAEMGLLALSFDEAHGGSGGPVETMIAMAAFGRALVLEPYLATVVLGGGLVRHGGSAGQKAALLPRVAAGDLVLAFGHTERQSRYDLCDVACRARRDGGSWILDGEKGVVLHGDRADLLLVTARSAGGRRDRGGIGLFLVDARADGVTRRGYKTQDGLRAAEVALANVRVDADAAIGDPEGALPVVERVVDEAMAALAAEAVGVMEALHALTIDHLKTRRQFGAAIGSFQALQHRAADMFVAVEQARSMAMLAAMMVGADDAAERHRNIAAAKIQIGRSGRFVGQQAIQLHGGIGMTMAYKAGHAFKRLAMIDMLFGDADHHLARLAAAGGLDPA